MVWGYLFLWKPYHEFERNNQFKVLLGVAKTQSVVPHFQDKDKKFLVFWLCLLINIIQ